MAEDRRFSFTKAGLNDLAPAPPGKRVSYYDSHRDSAGLMIRVTERGTKTFVVARRLYGGKVVWVSCGGFRGVTIEQARKRAREVTTQAVEGVNPNVEKKAARQRGISFGDLFDKYLDELRTQGKRRVEDVQASFERYLGAIPVEPRKAHGRMRAKPEGGIDWSKRVAATITVEDVKALHAKIGATGKRTTANRIVEIIAAMYAMAIREQWGFERNPAVGVVAFTEKSRTRFVKRDEAPRLLAALAEEEPQWRDLFMLALLTGARRGNVQAMHWQDLDFYGRHWAVPGEVSKNGEQMIIPLTEAAIAILNERKRTAAPTGVYVFPARSAAGHLMKPKKAWSRVLARSDLTDLTPHDLRRTLGSWMVQSGASIAIVGGALGHKDTKSTEVYARLIVDPVREAMERAQAGMGI